MEVMMTDDELSKLLAETTPGPWFTGGVNGGGTSTKVYCDDATGSAVADTVLQFVARSKPEAAANARLIAAAPTLAAEVLALRAEREKDHAEINLKADFIDKTINQLAAAEAALSEARAEGMRAAFDICTTIQNAPGLNAHEVMGVSWCAAAILAAIPGA